MSGVMFMRLRIRRGAASQVGPALGTIILSSQTFSTAVLEGATVATITGKTTGSTLSIIPDDGVLTISGTNLLRGPTTTSDATPTYTIVETLNSSPNSPKATDFAFTITPANAPVLQAWTSRRGALTVAGCGGVPASALMLVSGSNITSWTWTPTGANAATTALHWTTDSTSAGKTPVPTSAGVAAQLGGGPYTWNVTATNAAGVSNTVTHTINTLANAYSVATGLASTFDLATNRTGSSTIRTNSGGKTVLLSYGLTDNFPDDQFYELRLNAWNPTNPGRLTVTSEFYDDPAKYTTVRRLRLTTCSKVDVSKVKAVLWIDASNISAANQRIFGFTLSTCTDCTIDTITVGSSLVTGPFVQQWPSGLTISSCTNVHATNVRCYYVRDGIDFGSNVDSSVTTWVVDNFCVNATKAGISGLTGCTIEDGIICRPWRPIWEGPTNTQHGDCMQIQGTGATVSSSNNVLRNIRMYTADGNAAPQSLWFCNTTAPIQQNTWTIRNIFYEGAKYPGLHMERGTGWDVKYCTFIRGPLRGLGLTKAEFQSYGVLSNFYPPKVDWDGADSAGVVEGVVAMGCIPSDRSNFANFNTRNFMLDERIGALNTTAAGAGSSSEDNDPAFLEAYYDDADLFAGPSTAGIYADFPAMTAEEIDAWHQENYCAKEGGPLETYGGVPQGMWKIDQTLNDGVPV